MSNEVLWLIIKLLVGVITGFLSLAVAVGGYMHKAGMRRLDAIDKDLRKLLTEFAVIRQKQDDMHARLNNHEERIKALENKHK